MKQPSGNMARIIALFSHQRECCKTAAAINVATLLGRIGRRVAIISTEPRPAVVARDELVMTAPASELDPVPAWQLCLDEVPATVEFIILDGPPTQLLARCRDIILVCDPTEGEAITRLAEAQMDVIGILADHPEARLLGVLMTRTDQDLELFERSLLAVERSLAMDVFPFSIPRAVRMDASDPRIVLTAPSSRQARGYIELSMEILSHE